MLITSTINTCLKRPLLLPQKCGLLRQVFSPNMIIFKNIYWILIYSKDTFYGFFDTQRTLKLSNVQFYMK